jgi:hypothetical protein
MGLLQRRRAGWRRHLFCVFVIENQMVIDLNLSIRRFFVRSSAMRTQAASAAGEFKRNGPFATDMARLSLSA